MQVADDATFGPIISFGQGGTTADIVGDVSADLPPLNLPLAHGLIARTRAAALMKPSKRASATLNHSTCSSRNAFHGV